MLRSASRRLAKRIEGAATIELALVAPMLATMLIGVVDTTMAFNRKLELEQAVQRAIERVQQTTIEDTVEANIKQEVASAADIDEANVTVSYSLTCNGASVDATEDCAAGQTEVRYLDVSATDSYTPILPLSALGLNYGSYSLRVATGLRTS